ncbi:MAG: M20/M25/M40 family metallo-hydrolase [Terriglobia bacterium]
MRNWRIPLTLLLALLMSVHSPASEISLATLAQHPAVARALQAVDAQLDWTLEQQIRITEIPAPPFQEAARARYFEEQFRKLGLENVRQDAIGNVLGEYRGRDRATWVMASAHLDTVFPPETPVCVKRQGKRLVGPGISDNSNGLATLLALIRALRTGRVATTASLLFVANVGEEGEGNLRGIKHLFDDAALRKKLRAAIAIDGSGNERLTRRALGSKRLEVIVRGPGGHSWGDLGLPNPIQALGRAIAGLATVPVPEEPRTVLNVGVIEGGTSVNSIPYQASMKIDIRSEEPAEIVRLEEAVRQVVDRAVTAENTAARRKEPLRYEIKVIGERPGGELPESAHIAEVFLAVDRHLGLKTHFRTASTDANIPISMGLEAVAVSGGGRSGSSHSLREWYDPTNREVASKRILLALLLLTGVEP